jgi:L-ascorbate metabolism protein UlaG (beta-lactamase superfamily)
VKGVQITHIGGPTVLLEVGGWRLLTDPTFDSPGRRYVFGWSTASRKLAGPAISASELPPIDAVTHDHHGTVLYDGVRQVANRLDVDTALLHLGGVRFPVSGPVRYTMTAEDAVELCRVMRARTVIPVHYEGWKHFRQGREAIEREVAGRAGGHSPALPVAAPRRRGRGGLLRPPVAVSPGGPSFGRGVVAVDDDSLRARRSSLENGTRVGLAPTTKTQEAPWGS